MDELIALLRDRAGDAGGDKLLEDAAAALEAAREDVARLDWLGLGEDRTCYVGMDDRWTVQDGMSMVGGDTLRAAIDQARGKVSTPSTTGGGDG